MKKRLLSALLALALVFVLLPTTALAKVVTSDEDISIAGIDWKFGSDSEVGYFYNGNFTTDEPNGSYLKLTKNSNTITVTVYGNVTVSDIKVHKNFDIGEKINLIITGGNKRSTLTLNCTGISGAALETFQSGDITIKDGITVNANFSADNTDKYTDCYGIRASKNLIITGKGTTVNAVNADDAAAVKVDGNITVSDGAQLKATNKYSKKVTSYTDNAYAIECGGQLSISGDKTQVTAKTSNGKKAISGTVSNGDKLTFKVQLYLASSTLYQKPMDKALGYKYVEITQAPTDPYVLIAGEQAIIGQETPIPGGSGTYLYKDEGNNGSTLTLKDATINKDSIKAAQAIRFGQNGYYTIKLEGENKISGFSSGIVAPKDPGVDDVTVVLSGSGSLDISANQYAIDMQVGKLKFENTGKIKLTTGYEFTYKPLNALHVAGKIIIDNTKYDIVGKRQDADGTIEKISDSSAFTPDLLNGYTVGGETTLFKTITITPAAAKPSTISYGGTTLKQGETIYGETSGTATVATKGNTITLNNFKGTKALSFEATLADSTLVLEGTNTLSSIVTTQKGLTISGSGSLTVGSIRVTNNDNIRANLTITNGAKVTVNRPGNEDARAIDIKGDLTVTNGSLTATSKSDSVPTVQVGGNASFTGSTVTITNNSDRQGKSGEYSYAVSTGLYVGGTLDIKNAAKVTSTVIGGNAIYAKGDITISGDGTKVEAQNSAYKFSAISTNGTVNISDNSTVEAENLKKHQGDPNNETDPSTGKTYNACPAITGKIANKNTQNKLHIEGFTTSNPGTSNPTDGVVLNLDINPSSAVSYILHYDVTITRGDAYETPQVAANYTIAGQTMYVGKYYKTDASASGNITEGTAQDYNIFCDSENDFTLNNATISSIGTSGRTGVIMTDPNASSNEIHIKLIGTNSINNAGHHAILGKGSDSTIIIENAENASNASLTISGNFLPVYSFGNVTINAEVVIINTNGNGYLISTNKGGHANGAFDLGSGYKCYASASTTGNPLEEFNSANYGTYKYLRVTTQTPETGGGSTHEHVWDEAWHDTGDYHHAHQCTICKAYDTTTQELHNVTGHRDNHDGSHSNICGSCGYSAKVSHSYTWAPNANDNEKHIGTCVCGNVVEKNHNFVGDVCSDCGYDKSTGTTCEHVWTTEWTIDTVDNEYHWHKCIKCNAITDKKPHAYTIVTDSGTNHIRECECKVFYVEDHISSDWIIDAPATPTTAGSMHKECTVCKHKMQTEVIPATGEIVPPTPDNPGTIVIIRPAEEEKPAQQPNPSTGANDLVGLAVAAAVAAALGSAALLRKHD